MNTQNKTVLVEELTEGVITMRAQAVGTHEVRLNYGVGA